MEQRPFDFNKPVEIQDFSKGTYWYSDAAGSGTDLSKMYCKQIFNHLKVLRYLMRTGFQYSSTLRKTCVEWELKGSFLRLLLTQGVSAVTSLHFLSK